MSAENQTPLLELEDVSKAFVSKGKTLTAVRSVSLALEAGEALGVVGESGCGKTTLARMVLRLIEPSSGAIRFEGRDVTRLSEKALRPTRRHVQAVFQDPYGSLNPRMRVADVVAEPLRAFGIGASERASRVTEALGTVGLPPDAGSRFPHAFSGGQRQRIAIARALVLRPKLLVCDEAVSALDLSVQASILNLLRDVQQRFGLALLFISHNMAVVRHLCQRVAVMYAGQIVEMASEAALFDHPRHPYTAALLRAVPRGGQGLPRVLAGETPSPYEAIRGCAFRARCSEARDDCAREPELAAWDDAGHRGRCHFPLSGATVLS